MDASENTSLCKKKIKSDFKTFSGDALIGTVRIHQILAAIHEITIFKEL